MADRRLKLLYGEDYPWPDILDEWAHSHTPGTNRIAGRIAAVLHAAETAMGVRDRFAVFEHFLDWLMPNDRIRENALAGIFPGDPSDIRSMSRFWRSPTVQVRPGHPRGVTAQVATRVQAIDALRYQTIAGLTLAQAITQWNHRFPQHAYVGDNAEAAYRSDRRKVRFPKPARRRRGRPKGSQNKARRTMLPPQLNLDKLFGSASASKEFPPK